MLFYAGVLDQPGGTRGSRRGAPRQHRHGLHEGRTRARHHHPLGLHLLQLGRPPVQPHRHARTHRLQPRSRTLSPRPRRSSRHHRWRQRRADSKRDCLETGQQVRRAQARLRQQDGPHRRQLRAEHREHRRQAQLQSARLAVPRHQRQRHQVHRRRRRHEGDRC